MDRRRSSNKRRFDRYGTCSQLQNFEVDIEVALGSVDRLKVGPRVHRCISSIWVHASGVTCVCVLEPSSLCACVCRHFGAKLSLVLCLCGGLTRMYARTKKAQLRRRALLITYSILLQTWKTHSKCFFPACGNCCASQCMRAVTHVYSRVWNV